MFTSKAENKHSQMRDFLNEIRQLDLLRIIYIVAKLVQYLNCENSSIHLPSR